MNLLLIRFLRENGWIETHFTTIRTFGGEINIFQRDFLLIWFFELRRKFQNKARSILGEMISNYSIKYSYINFSTGNREIPIRWLTIFYVLKYFPVSLQPRHLINLLEWHIVLTSQCQTSATLDILFCFKLNLDVWMSICNIQWKKKRES